jgi:hypothetical protein
VISDVSLQIVGKIPTHLFALRSIPRFLLATVGAVAQAAASLEVFAAHAADV